jgi:hypothetical protein
MSTISVDQQVRVNALDSTVFLFDWDSHFSSGVELTDAAAAIGAFTIEDVSVDPEPELTLTLEIGFTAFLAGSGKRKVIFQVNGGTPEHVYRISHSVTTANESPVQMRTQDFLLWVEE